MGKKKFGTLETVNKINWRIETIHLIHKPTKYFIIGNQNQVASTVLKLPVFSTDVPNSEPKYERIRGERDLKLKKRFLDSESFSGEPRIGRCSSSFPVESDAKAWGLCEKSISQTFGAKIGRILAKSSRSREELWRRWQNRPASFLEM